MVLEKIRAFSEEMEGDVGAGVVPPLFLQQPFLKVSNLVKKRDFPWQNPNPSNPLPNWNPRQFNWDSASFAVRPSLDELNSKSAVFSTDREDGESLSLSLGGGGVVVTEMAGRPSKKVRSGSPGSTGAGGGNGSYPMCQVDDCRADLSKSKDYHRRHKVCEIHSKAINALVGMQIQRFCQQCSRFHLLTEFDEGKRSCRRRLAGHNRRRRKTQPEDASSQLPPTANLSTNSNGNLDVVKVLGMLARLQDTNAALGASSRLDTENVVQILSKMQPVPPTNIDNVARMPASGLDLNISQVPPQGSSGQSPKANGNSSLAVFSTTLATSSLGALPSLSQISSDSCGDDKGKEKCANPVGENTANNHSTHTDRAATNSCTLRSYLELSKYPVEEAPSSLSFQLFNSPEDDRPPKMDAVRKHMPSESSNTMEESFPSYLPPVVKEFFPLHSVSEITEQENLLVCHQDSGHLEVSTPHKRIVPLELFKEKEKQFRSGESGNLPRQDFYTSYSGSDHLPSTSNSDLQERTERITFKLFDKDPSNLPGTLRTQILDWLSNSPLEMESYIRPGCVVLSVYASMSSKAWNELENNLLQRVTSLVQLSESDFWRSGRFFVSINKQMVSQNEGKVRLCRSWRTKGAPELTLVTPIAAISGRETTFVLRGHNLTVPGTKIHCTFFGHYFSKEVVFPTNPDAIHDASSVENFSLNRRLPDGFGRCFIEVENGGKGNSFPLIVADAIICQELGDLEKEFGQDKELTEAGPTAEVLHFLNELGWLFQRKKMSSNPVLTDFSSSRFRFLLTFSVERDWLAVVRTVLDMLVQQTLRGDDSVQHEFMEMLLEVQLLIRAVKRKCRKMVDLLVQYSVKNDGSKMYLFPPNSAGPAGVTPLHLAASMQDSEDMVDALTNDPQEIGLQCWSSIIDDNGHSPQSYASATENHSYNTLVSRKLADRDNCQISVSITNQDLPTRRPPEASSCSKCAFMEKQRFKSVSHSRGVLQRPYIHSMLAIAAVCVCVCVVLRGAPQMDCMVPFKWENIEYGPR